MNRLRAWLERGRPWLGAALLLAAGLSIAMLLYEGSRAPAAVGLPGFRGADKVLHFGAHFWVSALMYWGFALQRKPATPRTRIAVAVIVVLAIDVPAGVAVEYIQSSLGSAHGRVFDWKDVTANILGTVVAVTASLAIAHRVFRMPVNQPELR